MSIRTLNPVKILAQLPVAEGYLLAYSGGADSSALLHVFAGLDNITAIHINHGLQDQASDWENHCRKICKKLDVPLIVEHAHLQSSSENSCRLARYDSFSKHLKSQHLLLLAHHASDQVETVLLKLLRGTGSKGIAGMQKYRCFAQAAMYRPFLQESPEALKRYLKSKSLKWIEDPSNQQNNYKRNLIRNKVLPLMRENFPNADENILRSADNISQSHRLLAHFIQENTPSLAIQNIVELPEDLRLSFFYQWLSIKNLLLPDKKALASLLADFIHAQKDKSPSYSNEFYQLLRWNDAIYCIKNFAKISEQKSFRWQTKYDFILPNNCGIVYSTGSENIELEVRFNQVGERLKLAAQKHHKKVKKLFQEQRIPPWEKSNTPYIYLKGQLISLGWPWSHSENCDVKLTLKISPLVL